MLLAVAGDVDAPATAEERCEYSNWSEWSPCSKTCGNDGVQERQRRLLPVNGQRRTTCGATLRLRRRMCSNLPPCDDARHTVDFLLTQDAQLSQRSRACFMSLNISLSHPRSFEITPLSRACVCTVCLKKRTATINIGVLHQFSTFTIIFGKEIAYSTLH